MKSEYRAWTVEEYRSHIGYEVREINHPDEVGTIVDCPWGGRWHTDNMYFIQWHMYGIHRTGEDPKSFTRFECRKDKDSQWEVCGVEEKISPVEKDMSKTHWRIAIGEKMKNLLHKT